MMMCDDDDYASKITHIKHPLPPICILAWFWCPFWYKNGVFWCDKGPHYPPQLSESLNLMQKHLILIAMFFDENSTHKNPMFAPQLSNRIKIQPKNPPVIPYNCQILIICVVLLNFIAWWKLMIFDKNSRYKTHPFPPQLSKCIKYCPFCSLNYHPKPPYNCRLWWFWVLREVVCELLIWLNI